MVKLYALSVFYKSATEAKLLKTAYDLSSFSFFQRGSVQEFISFASKTIVERTPLCARQSVKQDVYLCHVYVRSDNLSGEFNWIFRDFKVKFSIKNYFCSCSDSWPWISRPRCSHTNNQSLRRFYCKNFPGSMAKWHRTKHQFQSITSFSSKVPGSTWSWRPNSNAGRLGRNQNHFEKYNRSSAGTRRKIRRSCAEIRRFVHPE